MPLVFQFGSNQRLVAPNRCAVVAANELAARLPALRGRAFRGDS